MICIFCRRDSSASRSVEHVIPESLGNLTYTLPCGVVCDQCNNYFSREVEKPFLDCAAISLLRFHEAIPSKRGKIPAVNGVITPGIPAIVRRSRRENPRTDIEVPEEALEYLRTANGGTLIIPAGAELPTGPIVSRFLAKAAVETMAAKLIAVPDALEHIANDAQLDLVRNHARRGETREWPFHSRRIYAQNEKLFDELGMAVQMVHESDILITDENEWFFVLAIFGLELAINFGGPEIDGYRRWLELHDQASPLYYGKNATPGSLRPPANTR